MDLFKELAISAIGMAVSFLLFGKTISDAVGLVAIFFISALIFSYSIITGFIIELFKIREKTLMYYSTVFIVSFAITSGLNIYPTFFFIFLFVVLLGGIMSL